MRLMYAVKNYVLLKCTSKFQYQIPPTDGATISRTVIISKQMLKSFLSFRFFLDAFSLLKTDTQRAFTY